MLSSGITFISIVMFGIAAWVFQQNLYQTLLEQANEDNKTIGNSILSLLNKVHKDNEKIDSLIGSLQNSCNVLKLPNNGFICATNDEGALLALPDLKTEDIGKFSISKAVFNSFQRQKIDGFAKIAHDTLFTGYYEYPERGYSDIIVKIKHKSGLNIFVHQDNNEIMRKASEQSQKLLLLGIVFSFVIGIVVYIFVNIQVGKYQAIIFTQSQKIIQAHEAIEEQHKNTLASIHYASRIQNALLPEKSIIEQYIPQLLLFYAPKDIVSGDFYWFSNTNGLDKNIILAIADCTGHGVSGAFMTVIGENLLDQIINKNKTFSPAQILTELDKQLLATLQHQGDTQKIQDGMDISILKLDIYSNKIGMGRSQTSFVDF